jgi:hypothetical protein
MLFNWAGSESQERREVSQMKKTISLLSKLLLAAALFWAVPAAEANQLVETEVIDLGAGYCHMKFAPMSEATLSWGRPELNTEAEKSIDFYGPCDYDPTGAAEVRAQRTILLRELHGDGSND